MLKESGDKYIFEEIKRGVTIPLPDYIENGIDTESEMLAERRIHWNEPADNEYALTTEIWREVVDRRKRYKEIRSAIEAGEIICAMTDHVKEKDKFDPYYARWWLRSPGEWDRRELEVYIDGDMGGSGVEVDYGNGTARPAMWVAMAALKSVGTDSIPYLAETTTSLKEAIEEVAKGRTLNEQIVLLNEITSLYSEEITKTDWGEELDRIRVNAKKEDLIPKVNKAKKAKLSAKLFQNKKIITLYDNQGDFYLLGDFYVRIPEKHRATSLQEANGIIYLKQEFERRTDYTGPAFDRLYDVYWIERKSRKAVKIYSECSSPPFSGYGTLYGKEIPLETIWDDIKEFIK